MLPFLLTFIYCHDPEHGKSEPIIFFTAHMVALECPIPFQMDSKYANSEIHIFSFEIEKLSCLNNEYLGKCLLDYILCGTTAAVRLILGAYHEEMLLAQEKGFLIILKGKKIFFSLH